MKKKVMVNIGYNEFTFDGDNAVEEAVLFAETARRTLSDDRERDIYVSITFEKEDE